MQRTLIAVFDNRGDAQSALDELVAAGFARQDVRLSEGDPTGAPTAADADTEPEGLMDSIKHFLSNMFGTDDSEYVQKYTHAVTRGHHVLTLTAPNEPEVERAADIVERWGPVDIDEKVAEWSGGALAGEAMRMGAGAQQQSASMSQQSTQQGMQGAMGSAQGTMQGGSGIQPGSQQRAAGADSGTAIPVTGRSGVRVFEHIAEPPIVPGAEVDDVYFQSHYNANYAGEGDTYDDYAPAYQYGSSMAADEQYHGRLWKDVEPALRTDWEDRNPGSAWAKVKAAVRHGWERITS